MLDPLFRPPEEVRDEMYRRLLREEGIDPDALPWVGSSDPPSVPSGCAAVLYVEGPTPGSTFELYVRLLRKKGPTYQVNSSFMGDRSFSYARVFYAGKGPHAPQDGMTQRWVVVDPMGSAFEAEQLLHPTASAVGFELLACTLQQPNWVASRAGEKGIWMPAVRWENRKPVFRTITLGGAVQWDLPGGPLASVQAAAAEEEEPPPRQMVVYVVFEPRYHTPNAVNIFFDDCDLQKLVSPSDYGRTSREGMRIPRLV